jgi:thiamine pyrophosphate-dependent acetolactate synthase large subunit-like protein
MVQNGADFFWTRLYEWGVRCVFGYPGDGINGLLGGLQRLGEDKIRFIQVRHEEMAAFNGVGLCEVHWQARRMLGHLRSGRISPDHRAL